jgi:hypothetical protein
MSVKCCTTCVFCKPSTKEFSMATCEYPVPEWLTIACSRYIANPGYSGSNCATYKSLQQISEAVINAKSLQ